METFDLINSENQANSRLLKINSDTVTFLFSGENNTQREIALPIGYQLISVKYFKHPIPTVAEIDYAINTIEDALMINKQLVNSNEKLICTDPKLIEIVTRIIEPKLIFSRREIEDLFNKYANISMGEPQSRYHFEVIPEEYAIVLILREIMHHLKFETISFVNK